MEQLVQLPKSKSSLRRKILKKIVVAFLALVLLGVNSCNDLVSDKESSSPSSPSNPSSPSSPSNPTRAANGRFIPEPEKVTGAVPTENPVFVVYPDLQTTAIGIENTRKAYARLFGESYPKIAYTVNVNGYLYVYDSNKEFLSEYYVYVVIKDVIRHKINIYINSFEPNGKSRYVAPLTNVKIIGDYYYYPIFKGDIESASYVTYTLDSGTLVKIDNLSKNSNKLIEL